MWAPLPYPACLSPHNLYGEGAQVLCGSPTRLKRDPACRLQDPPSRRMHQKHHKKRGNVHKLLLNIERRITGNKKAREMRDSPSIERWGGKMQNGVNFTMLII